MEKKENFKKAPKIELPWIHYGRILGSLAVITLHTSSHVSSSIAQWVMIASSIWAVPVFVMISGSLMPTNLAHRLKRLLPPTIFWIGVFFYYYHPGKSLISWSALIDITVVGSVGHLYYLIAILQLALITPVLQILVHTLTNSRLLLVISLFACVGFVWRSIPLTITYFLPYVSYYLLGNYLLDKKASNTHVVLARIGFIFFGLVLFICLQLSGGNWYLFQHGNPLIFGLAVTAFFLIKYDRFVADLFRSVATTKISYIASLTLGVYILHPFFLDIIWQFQPTLAWYVTPIIIILTSGISAITTHLLRKIEVVKKIGLL